MMKIDNWIKSNDPKNEIRCKAVVYIHCLYSLVCIHYVLFIFMFKIIMLWKRYLMKVISCARSIIKFKNVLRAKFSQLIFAMTINLYFEELRAQFFRAYISEYENF